jgi:hypothetical protein
VKPLFESEAFQAELPGWTLRGMLCAANSAFWAWMMGFQAPAEIAGMVAGVAFWVAVFAGVCVWNPQSRRWRRTEIVAALKWAAWIKIGLSAGGWLVFAAASAVSAPDLSPIAMFGMVDMLLGMAALAVVAFMAGLSDPARVAAMDSFGWTALTTVVEGVLMALVIVAIAVVVWLVWRGWDACWQDRSLSPVRNPD